MFNKYIPDSAPITARFDSTLLGGVVVLEGRAKELQGDGEVSDVSFRAIPYATWNNRGPQQMAVWIANRPASE